MADSPLKSPLQKPPGYKDPNAPPTPDPRPPPRKPPLPPSFYPKKKRRNCCRICCCVFCFLFLFVIVAVSLAAALFYLLVDPKLPVFHLQSFRISQFEIDVKPDGSFLDARTVTRVEFKNPNEKLSVSYGKIEYELMVGEDTELGEHTVGGFTQGTKNTTSLKLETSVENEALDMNEGPKLNGLFKSRELAVKVEARTTVGMVFQGWRIGPVAVKLQCDSKLKSIDGGQMPKCNINLLRWINIH